MILSFDYRQITLRCWHHRKIDYDNSFTNLQISYSIIVLQKTSSHQNGKKQMFYHLTKKKKKDKQSDKNYWLASFHPTCSKVFERIIYNKMFAYFTENNLVPKNQSRFRPAGSCVNQTLAICNLFSSDQSGLKPAGSCVKQLLAITH